MRDYEVDIMNLQRARALKPAATEGGLIEVELESGATLRGKTVILSTGARWRNMNVPGEEPVPHQGRDLPCPHCDGPLFKGKRVAVIGGGNSASRPPSTWPAWWRMSPCSEFAPELKADAVLQRKLKSLPNVDVILNAQTTEVSGDGHKGHRHHLQGPHQRGAVKQIALEGIFVQIGLLPNTDWLKGHGRTVEVWRNRGRCPRPHQRAWRARCGDCTTVPYKQIIIAAGAGATAALECLRPPDPDVGTGVNLN